MRSAASFVRGGARGARRVGDLTAGPVPPRGSPRPPGSGVSPGPAPPMTTELEMSRHRPPSGRTRGKAQVAPGTIRNPTEPSREGQSERSAHQPAHPRADPRGPAGVWLLPNPSGLNASYQPPALTAAFAELRAATFGPVSGPKVAARS